MDKLLEDAGCKAHSLLMYSYAKETDRPGQPEDTVRQIQAVILLPSGADTGFLKGGGTVYETLPEAVHRGA